MIINLAKIRFGGSGGGTSPAKPEDFFQETYTANGNYDVAPQAGHVFSGGQIEVNVQPRLQTKEATPLTLAQTVSPDAGYDGLQSVTVTGVTSEIDSNITADNIKKDVTILGVTGTLEKGIIPTGTININTNGTYDVTDKATANVNVGSTDYRYKTGTPDVIGLAAIGWDADSIGYYGANNPHYAWQNDNYKVSQKNIDLYNLDDPNPSLYKNDPEVTFVPNKNMSTYFGTTSCSDAFWNMKYIRSIPLYDTSRMTNMGSMFRGCSSLETIPLLDTSNATDMRYMFRECSSIATIPPLNTSNVTDMQSMFYFCPSLETIPQLDTSSVTNMSGMFNGCSSLVTIPPLNTSNVTNISSIFRICSSLQSIPLLDTSNATKTTEMFSGCSSLVTIPLLDTSKVTDMRYMFSGCGNLKTIPPLNTSKVTDMTEMFRNCSSLETIPLLDTSNVTKTTEMFRDCSSLVTIPLLDTSKVTDMSQMFRDCSKLKEVSIDASNATNMGYMFNSNSNLEKVALTSTSKNTNFTQMFYVCTNLIEITGIDFSSMTRRPSYIFGYYSMSNIKKFLVEGSINISWDDSYGLNMLSGIDYDSIKSILEAMNRTTNTDAKTMRLGCVVEDRNGELASLVASCAAKGWTITGLNIFDRPFINSITPSIDHIHISDMRSSGPGLTLTIDANYAWKGAGVPKDHLTDADYIGYQYDFYDANTDELVRTGKYFSRQSGLWSPYTGSEGVTSITGHYGSSDLGDPRSGEYAKVGISFKNATAPYIYQDYYFKVYPDGE